MKINHILIFMLITTSTIAFSAERPLKRTKQGDLDVLPAELRLEQIKAIASKPLKLEQAIANIKRYYIAHPPSQQSLGFTQAVLTHLMNEYNFDYNELQNVVDMLAKRETMTVFQNNEMLQWIAAQKDRLDKEDALIEAAGIHNTKKVKELLAQGINVNAIRGNFKVTPIIAAFSRTFNAKDKATTEQFNEMVQALLNAGADINSRDGMPLGTAINMSSPTTVKLLLDAGANPHLEIHGKEYLTAAAIELFTKLYQATMGMRIADTSDSEQVIALLLKRGLNPNIATIKDDINRTLYVYPEDKANAIKIFETIYHNHLVERNKNEK